MRKIKAHYIFDGKKLHKYATLILNDSQEVEEIIEGDTQEEEGVEFYSGIICPGFVNAHCHLELSHLHNQIPENLGLGAFVHSVISLRSMPIDMDALQKADATMFEEGISAVGDISNKNSSNAIKQNSRIYYHTFFELFDLFDDNSMDIFNAGKELFREYNHIASSLTPHAPYSSSRKLIEKICKHAEHRKYPISIHNQETADENKMFLEGSGNLYRNIITNRNNTEHFYVSSKSSLQTYAPWFTENNHLLFVHNLHISKEDIAFIQELRESNTFTFVLCPLSNIYIEQELPNISLLKEHNIAIAIGTDSLASNKHLSIIKELQCLQENNPHISLEYLLTCATSNGAKALGINKRFGSFAKEACPGVILLENVNLQTLQLQPQTSVKRLI